MNRLRSLLKARPSQLNARAWYIAGAYALFATLWILYSDRALVRMVQDPETLLRLSVYKGIAFVAVTSVLLLLLIRRAFGAIVRGYVLIKTKEAQLRTSQEQLASIIDSAMDAIITTDAEGRIQLFNAAAERVFGVASLDASGSLLQTFMQHTDGMDDRRGAPAEIPMAGSARLRGVRSNGESFPIEASVSRILVGGSPYITYIVRDISERERAAALVAGQNRILAMVAEGRPLRESLDALVLFLESQSPDMLCSILLLDRDGVHVRHGAAPSLPEGYWRMIDGAAIGPEEGSCGTAAYHKVPVVVEDIASDPLWRGYRDVALPHGLRACWSTPIFDPHSNVLGTFAIYHGEPGRPTEWHQQLIDIATQLASVAIFRSNVEQDLREAKELLEVKVAERTAELQAALARAESADRLKSAFLATMSHELRTPLNSIIGFTGIVLQGLAGPLNDEQTKQLGMVRSSAHHLLELINDVLDLSKIEAGQLEVKAGTFNAVESIERAVELIRPMAVRKGLTVDTVISPEVGAIQGDRRRTEQILINLLNNAVKFTERGGIRLVAELTDQVSGNGVLPECVLRVSVSDTGIGISEEELQVIFLPFHQVDSGLSRQHEGTGLGLAICRRLADLLGGRITVRSEVMRGSEFVLEIPITSTGGIS